MSIVFTFPAMISYHTKVHRVLRSALTSTSLYDAYFIARLLVQSLFAQNEMKKKNAFYYYGYKDINAVP